ncbi:MAG: hypothetical protein WD690_20125 [Vicinamibacterales bacterium]
MTCSAAAIRRAVPAWLAAAAMFFASAAPLAAGHLAVDSDCVPAIAASHDHGAHRLSRQDEPLPDHCAACHLTRSVRGASFAQILLAAGHHHTAIVQPDGSAAQRADVGADLTRGPPSL